MTNYKFTDFFEKPLTIPLEDEETAVLFAKEMNLTYVGKVDE
jgi:hypothetical protein